MASTRPSMRTLPLPLALLVLGSLGCTMNASPTDEDPAVRLVGNEESPLPIGTLDPSPTCEVRRFDFALSATDTRTCASFTKRLKTGAYTGFYSFPDAPAAYREKRCAVIWSPVGSPCFEPVPGNDLGLWCDESLSLIERSKACAAQGVKTGLACRPAAPHIDDQPTTVTPEIIPRKCARPSSVAIQTVPAGSFEARMYTGGCTSCGVINNGTLILTAPTLQPTMFVTYYDNTTSTPSPRRLGLTGVNGPITIDLSARRATGPVVVSY